MASEKDRLFSEQRPRIDDFDFGEKTAAVFDDMLDRSVPFYREIQRMMGEIAGDFAVPGTNLYDLGCSTGNTFIYIDERVAPEVSFIGVDSSPEMLEKARRKLDEAGIQRPCELVLGDLNKGVDVENASVVILNLTLQFVRPLYRTRVMRRIAEGVNEGGCLILVEKVLSPHSLINRLFIKYYYDFKKRNGYTEMEIAQKREALENVLIPYHYVENQELLLDCGFSGCDLFFRWYNFCGLIAVK